MSDTKTNDRMEKIVSLCKRRGFIFQSSEIYGGLHGFWDYGPLGAELKRNLKDYWWRCLTQTRDDIAGLDASIIMHPKIWEASGHTSTFTDLMVDCLLTKKRFRADQIEPQSGLVFKFSGADNGATGKFYAEPYAVLVPAGKPPEHARKIACRFYQQRGVDGPQPEELPAPEKVENSTRYNPENGSLLTEPRKFNLMLKTYVGPVESEENVAYLRPETAQAIFAQFKNVLEVSRQKVPFGICQIGKAFRNEINPRNFTFRSREFEQMEIEFFIKPDAVAQAIYGKVASAAEVSNIEHRTSNAEHRTSDPQPSTLNDQPQPDWGWEAWHKYWVEQRIRWYESMGLPRATLVEYWQKPEELAHYARATVDILFKFPFSKRDA